MLRATVREWGCNTWFLWFHDYYPVFLQLNLTSELTNSVCASFFQSVCDTECAWLVICKPFKFHGEFQWSCVFTRSSGLAKNQAFGDLGCDKLTATGGWYICQFQLQVNHPSFEAVFAFIVLLNAPLAEERADGRYRNSQRASVAVARGSLFQPFKDGQCPEPTNAMTIGVTRSDWNFLLSLVS